jgi:hypothetical protein
VFVDVGSVIPSNFFDRLSYQNEEYLRWSEKTGHKMGVS